jgi:hypothetical protein
MLVALYSTAISYEQAGKMASAIRTTNAAGLKAAAAAASTSAAAAALNDCSGESETSEDDLDPRVEGSAGGDVGGAVGVGGESIARQVILFFETPFLHQTSRCPYCAFGFHCKFRGMRSLKLCHSCQIMSFMSNHVIWSNYVIHFKSCHSCQIM